ncbi:hypothetical protein ASG11_00335 [Sphingomonas sp. Leaf357]|uniref:hypothetical protein n=1 Tax=Sphingomonas sp. Leaf357 TaxID=1736350 RepID=UPI000700D61D|nr:hypothetical protein [Sphingomonas sp. Leaf357]KQS02914.1 hypothetical protein ASG11_00335 [Sphingomonas sp. Leaf357]
MRPLHCLLFFAAVPSTAALAAEPPFYGPMNAWDGVGFKDSLQKDGTYRIVAGVRSGEAIDLAVYRAAELADQLGFAYVELLGGSETRSSALNSATLYARPSRSATAPAACLSKRRYTCSTADVRQLLRAVGGTGGGQPGVAVAHHVDRYGRQVFYSGPGIGAVLPPRPVPLPARPDQASLAQSRGSTDAPYASIAIVGRTGVAEASDPQTRYKQALDAARPVKGREPRLGWTVSD